MSVFHWFCLWYKSYVRYGRKWESKVLLRNRLGKRQMTEQARIKFHYIKAGAFRECHISGVIGGPTSSGLWFGAFSERSPVPQTAVHVVQPVDGQPDVLSLGEMIRGESESKDGIIRTLEVGLHMDIATAETLYQWLGRHLKSPKQDIT